MKKTTLFIICLFICVSFISKAQERQNEERQKISASIDAQSEVLTKVPGWSRIETTEGKIWKQSDINDEISYIPRILIPGYTDARFFGFKSLRIYKFSLEGSSFYLLNKEERSGNNSYFVFTQTSLDYLKFTVDYAYGIEDRWVAIKYCGNQDHIFNPELIFQDKEMIRVLLLGKGSYDLHNSNECAGDSLFLMNSQVIKGDTIVRFNFEINVAPTFSFEKSILPLTNDYFELNKSEFSKLFIFSPYKKSSNENKDKYTSLYNAKYVGEYKNGKMNGQGTCTWPNGTKYEGEFKDSLICGQGTKTWFNGDKYEGEWKNNNRNGQGTSILSNGDKYVGEWKDDKMNGQGTYIWSNGDKYVGELKDDNMNGHGTWNWSNGNKYVGEIKDNKINGQGTCTWPNGDKYEGEWKDNNRNGQGTFIWSNGNKYVGELKDNMMNGQGTFTYQNGLKYVSEWKNDKMNGQGVETYSNGVEGYVGERKDDIMDGNGMITYSTGTKYVGEWKAGRKKGQGTMTWITGKKYVGEFNEDLPTGRGKYTYSKVIKN